MKKFALITGASGGIGRAIAEKLAADGYSLYLHYHENEASILELLNILGIYHGEYIPIKADLTSPEGYKTLADQIFSIDAIIHNSGISHYSLFVDTENEVVEKMMALHVTSPIYLTKALLPKMIRQQYGNILFITSIWGQTGSACEVVYSTVKGAQIAFVKSLAKEMALNGIRVNGIAPGAVNTSMMADFSDEEIEMIKSGIPMGRMAEPEDVADSVSFLLSEKAGYITGHILNVNGGWYT